MLALPVTLGPGLGGAVHHLHGGDDHQPAAVQDHLLLPQLAPLDSCCAAVTSLAEKLGCSSLGCCWAAGGQGRGGQGAEALDGGVVAYKPWKA